jgi:hypothetical protein
MGLGRGAAANRRAEYGDSSILPNGTTGRFVGREWGRGTREVV